MVILSPHTETAQSLAETAPGGPVEASQKKPEKNTLGVFAKILAGLKNRGLQGRGTQVSQKNQSAEALSEASVPDDLQPVSDVKGKGVRNGKKAVETAASSASKTKKSPQTGEIEPETLQIELSEQEYLIPFGVDRLTQPIRQDAAEGALPDFDAGAELRYDAELPDAVFAQAETATEGRQGELFAAAAEGAIAGEIAVESTDEGKKAKNSPNFAEIAAENKPASADKLAEAGAFRQTEANALAGENGGRNRLEEARNRRRAASFEVRDYREADPARRDSAATVKVDTRLPGEAVSKEITLELRLPNQGQEAPSAVTSWETKAGQAFEDILARELHQNFNNDIVRHASVILREGNEGIIRLALKPESLGNVKIRLEMAENKITGHIVVESEEALRAFEREISSLEKAFQESGFEGANLEMSLAADGRGADQWQETEASQTLPWQYAASRYDAAIEGEMPLALDFYRQGAGAVNLIA